MIEKSWWQQSEDVLEQRGVMAPNVPLLKKPVSPHVLLKAVRDMIDGTCLD